MPKDPGKAGRKAARREPSPPRDRAATKQETRDALVAAALSEFRDRGFDAPSLDGICARAGFTRGAFYVHFRNRDELLEAVMEKVFAAFLDAAIAGGGGAGDLAATVSRFASMVAAARPGDARTSGLDLEVHRVLDACARSPLLRRRFAGMFATGVARVEAAVRRGQEAGLVRDDVDAAGLAQLLAMLALGALTAVDTGVPIDVAAARSAALSLLASQRAAR